MKAMSSGTPSLAAREGAIPTTPVRSYAIYVLPAAQGQGHGRALIGECARALAAEGMTSMLIWVLRENRIGRGFYERLGGTVVREKPLEEFPGAEDHIEVAYGWKDTRPLVAG